MLNYINNFNRSLEKTLSIVFLIFLTSINVSAQETFIDATIGDKTFKVSGEKNCFFLEFAEDNNGIYCVENFDDIENTDGFIISINDSLKEGTYDFTKIPEVGMVKYGMYYTEGKNRYISSDKGDGKLTLTKIDGDYVSGSFEYVCPDPETKEDVNVKGTFTVKKMNF